MRFARTNDLLAHKQRDKLEVIGYHDLDFVKCMDIRISTYDKMFMLSLGFVSW